MSKNNNSTEPTSSESEVRKLIDGSEPASVEQVLLRLDCLGVNHSTIEHEALRTVEQSRQLQRAAGGYPKNFFLRNKKGKMWLLTLHEDTVVDLRDLAKRIGTNRVSFCSESRLMHYLGVIPGAVTPLAVINDNTQVVTAVLDQHLLTYDPLHFHPCDNTRTTTINRQGLLKFMQDCQHDPEIIDFSTITH